MSAIMSAFYSRVSYVKLDGIIENLQSIDYGLNLSPKLLLIARSCIASIDRWLQ